MVLSNFGESRKYSMQISIGLMGDPAVDIKLTNDGHLDMNFKRMCNVGDPDETYDACTKY